IVLKRVALAEVIEEQHRSAVTRKKLRESRQHEARTDGILAHWCTDQRGVSGRVSSIVEHAVEAVVMERLDRGRGDCRGSCGLPGPTEAAIADRCKGLERLAQHVHSLENDVEIAIELDDHLHC